MRIFIVCFIGLVYSFEVTFFVKNSGIYNTGIGAICQGISRFTYIMILKTGDAQTADLIFNVLFWGLYGVINIPLLIFS
jgi:uncharacterized membrane-anchored protein YitT (DUF2179 family)